MNYFNKIKKRIKFIFLFLIILAAGVNTQAPVSYTHLDVYKRQVLYQAWSRLDLESLCQFATPNVTIDQQRAQPGLRKTQRQIG